MKRILLKVSGELFGNTDGSFDKGFVEAFAQQLKKLNQSFTFGIVIGGGNFFRGAHEVDKIGISRSTADNVGMLATVMNALMLQEVLINKGVSTKVLNSMHMPALTETINQAAINEHLEAKHCIIFAGGTGNPYVTTDTNAVVRALQMQAPTVWKATKVDYVYDSDPAHNQQAQAIPRATYDEALDKKLNVMDATALTLARDHQLTIRVFNIFAPDALLTVAQDQNFGSTISN